jgi:asparagine synthase (glutamine-hydrolysing)
MASRIAHRGPDEDGFHFGSGIGLAFRRLRIIDLETGSQPQRNEDGMVRVVFNGEIYNHAELRRRLESRGHTFRTNSDTEVLVHLWEDLGPDLVNELNGMFAFAIWDENVRTLMLARDRLGIKPLLWADTGEGLVFGSEMGCLTAAGGIDDALDPVGIHQYLSWGSIPAPRTIFQGVQKLEPGHSLIWRNGVARVQRYWHPIADATEPPTSYEEARSRLRALLENSVRLRRAADVPLGAFLSGGVDSTAIVGAMSHSGEEVRTFSIGFSDDPVFDETKWAREAARFHGTNHTETSLSAADILPVIPQVLDQLDEPFGSASILPSFVVSRETRKHVTVALSGDGADELFAGYEKYLGEGYRQRWERIPPLTRRLLLEPVLRRMPASRGSRLGELGRKAHRFLDGLPGDAAERHDRWMRYASAEEVCALLGEPVTNPCLEVVQALHADYDSFGRNDPLNRTLFTDLSLALPTDMLRKVDTASMLNSLEVRVPFLDHRIVELAMAMPSEWKMQGKVRKRILRDAVDDLLPRSIRKRPKAGFDLPVAEWIKGDLRELFWDTVSGDSALPLDRSRLEGWYEEHRSGRAERAKILWAVFAFRWWERRRQASPPAIGDSEPMTAEAVAR